MDVINGRFLKTIVVKRWSKIHKIVCTSFMHDKWKIIYKNDVTDFVWRSSKPF